MRYLFAVFFFDDYILGGSSRLGYVVNNHGDRRSPK